MAGISKQKSHMIIAYYGKIKQMPIKGIMPCICRGIKNRCRHAIQVIEALFTPFFQKRAFNHAVSEIASSDVEALKKIMLTLKESYLFSWEDQKMYVNDFKSQFSEKAIAQVIADADMVCGHIFNFQGSDKRKLGKKIDWKADILTGIRWPSYNSKEVPIIQEKGSDIVRVWELSRFQWGPTLGKAYWLTKKDKYVNEFLNQIKDWCGKNPCGFGPNWVTAQDVALRAINWILTLCFIGGSSCISQKVWLKVISALYFHGLFIEKNLTIRWRGRTRITGNHYVSQILGLLFLGFLFNSTSRGASWLEYAISELESEIIEQVYPDGGQYESSIACYHRFVLEHFLSAYLLFLRNGIRPSECFVQRLEKMFDFVLGYTRPDGSTPQIGDTDDARVHILSNYSSWLKDNHLFLLSFGNMIFGHKYVDLSLKNYGEEAFWLLHKLEKKGLIPTTSDDKSKKRLNSSVCFPDSGFYFMKHHDTYMAISANPVGLNGKGNHKHNDILSFDLFANGRSYIVDPGSYVYTSDFEARNLFRSTEYHNTVMIDGFEINVFEEHELFLMHEKAKPFVKAWISEPSFSYFRGLHFGYTRLSNPLIHERRIFFSKPKTTWLIQDLVYPDTLGKVKKNDENTSKHNIVVNFHYATMELKKYYAEKPVIALSEIDYCQDYLLLSLKNNGNIPTFEAKSLEDDKSLVLQILDSPRPVESDILSGWISPSYGVKVEAPILRISGYWKCPISLLYLIAPVN